MRGQAEQHESRVVAFVVARLSSSRLPAKQLRTIGDRRVLEWIMHNLAGCEELDEVVLTTVAEPLNEPLRELAAQHDWACFWYGGEVEDVVGRLTQAAHAHAADICLLISADCPLVHGPSVDQLVRLMRDNPDADCLVLPGNEQGHVCLLEGVHVARRSAWTAAEAMSDRPELREHQFPVIYRNPQRFRLHPVRLPTGVYGEHHRMSVDTWADLEFMQAVHDSLQASGAPFALPQAVQLLSLQPELKHLNAHVHQRRLVESVRRVLLVVDAGGSFGFGHFMRSRELMGQLVERLGWPVSVLVDDEVAATLAQASGFHVIWGALGRDAAAPPAAQAVHINSDVGFTGHDLVVVDVSARRDLPDGWRKDLPERAVLVVLDREDAVGAVADLIINPGISGREATSPECLPPVVEGIDHVILRREVRRAMAMLPAKDVDLLVYLYDDSHKAAVSDLARVHGWRLHIADRFDSDFVSWLARSRVFLSGYGQSFYEALALQSCPVAWPLSAGHSSDAQAFYRTYRLPDLRVGAADALAAVLESLLGGELPRLPAVQDGTPAIVERLAGLFGHGG